jgi:Transglycosylase-like domain
MTTVAPAIVATEVKNQGGSNAQAWVAAALVDGIESNGDPTDKNPSSTACGLFQFLTTTWASNGGTSYAPTACDATWQQQVSVFITASGGPNGDNFYPWAPDLGGSYSGDATQAAATAPQPGSPVANKIAELSAGGTLSALGNVPTNWADSGSTVPASPTPLVGVGATGNGPSGVNVGGEYTGLTGLEQGIDTLLGDLTSAGFWERLGLFVAGAVLVVVGIVVFISTTKTGQKVESEGTQAAELAAVA